MPKQIIYNQDIRRRMQAGVDQIANLVKTTLGPRGRNVVIQNPSGSPMVTNDGATIAREIELEGRIENMGAQLIKEVALKTKEVAGDGTTTAVVLAQYILQEGLINLAYGANPMELKKGIQGATQLAAAAIQKLANPVNSKEVMMQVASTSAKDWEIGEMIANAMDEMGLDGVISVDESSGRETILDVKKGMQLNVGYLSPEMVTDKQKMAAELENPYILITDQKLTDPQELLSLQEQVALQNRPLLIIAEEVDSGVLGMLVMNKISGALEAVAIRPPAYGDGRRARMEDLAVLTGATFLTADMGYVLSETSLEMLGSAASVTVERNRTVIIGGAGDPQILQHRIQNLRMLIENTDYDFNKKQLQERLAKLTCGVAVIQVGATTELEMKEKRLRVENALQAAKAATVEGIVPGGGVVYLRILPAIEAYIKTLSGDMKTGAMIIRKALMEPARRIAENAGRDGRLVVAEMRRQSAGIGFNALSGEFSDMMSAGIVDPASVARLALQSAASISSVLLTIEVGITDSSD